MIARFVCFLLHLQLAAELGKTLLEHNRSLETTVKQQQALLDDRLQEIQLDLSAHIVIVGCFFLDNSWDI
ncbi:hypothetical protein HAZT_HAZT001958 [Hyalella azteca]|uniref:Uncharacterized protein n=1 Tax=Hyalella azteca TaxID=294128 RepID=A0A6A0HE69_HYAAZ|nr:hypothetical protein HAZT_HAZT001958 [Hyalella azteca]